MTYYNIFKENRCIARTYSKIVADKLESLPNYFIQTVWKKQTESQITSC